MSELSTQPYKGTRDFYPADMRAREWIFGRLRQVLSRFGYEEYDGPMLEPFELYASKTSEEIVNEQLYWLIDRGERKLAIRPEMTPTLARMVAAKQNELPKPIRWFSIPNLWRYERPQRGRLREHWQLNVDVFGGQAGPEDLEIAQVAVAIMQGFGATTQFEVRLNHRGITNYLFHEVLKLTPEKSQNVGRLLDASEKMGIPAFEKALATEGLSAAQIKTLLNLRGQQDLFEPCPDYAYLKQLLSALGELGIGGHFRFDPSLMRGFMYYTGLVLEVFDTHPDNNRALFGGGRYDNLVGMFGGKPLPGVGFGMGDVTLQNFLETHGLLPNFKRTHGLYVAHLGDGEWIPAQKICRELRATLAKSHHEIAILSALESQKPKKIFPSAEKLGARAVLLVGDAEVKSGVYPLKNLVTGTQVTVPVEKIAETLVAWENENVIS